MELAELIAWAVFALHFAFLGMVLGRDLEADRREARDAGVIRERRDEHRRR